MQRVYFIITMFQDRVTGIATHYGLDGGAGEIFCTHPDRPWAHPTCLTMGTEVSFSVVKRLWRGVDHPRTPSAEVKKEHSYTSTPSVPPIACYR